MSGRMSARITALETTQAEVRKDLSEMLMTSQNNEQSFASVHIRLDNLATTLVTIMNRLEPKSMVSQPDDSGGKHDATDKTHPKSPVENQAQSKPARVGASSVHLVDVVDVSYVPSDDDNPPKQYVRMTKSKDVKYKGVGAAAGASEVGLKTGRSVQVLKKKKLTRGGGSKACATEDGTVQVSVEGGVTEEVAVSHGGDVPAGGGTEKSTAGGSGGEAQCGSAGAEVASERGCIRQPLVKGDRGEAVSGGEGSVGEGKGSGQREESVLVRDVEAQVVAEDSTPAQSSGRGTSQFSVHVRSKNMSPSKLGGNGVQNTATGSEVSPHEWSPLQSIPADHNPPKLLIFNVHGTLLDTSILTQPNPNPHIRVTKKTKTRRFVYRPWMMEFLGRCFKNFTVAFWGIKSCHYMEEVLHEISPVFEHMEGQKPLFCWSSKDCEPIQISEDITTWGKPLRKVWQRWPCWNHTNTLIVDHHGPRVESNPPANVLVPPPFYVANMKDVAEDNDYLKMKLWPALEALCPHEDVARFWASFQLSPSAGGPGEVNPLSRRRPCTPPADPRLQVIGGEGTCVLGGDNRHCPLTCNSMDV